MNQQILYVEDDRAIGEMSAKRFGKGLEATVTWVARNEDAIAFMKRTIPSLVISDLGRPDGDGEELVAYIRRAPRLREVPIMIVSGQLFTSELGKRVFEHRIDAAFEKPQTVSTLLAAASRLLGRVADPDVVLLRVGSESISLDYKADVALADKRQRAGMAKDVIAFANSGGGSIVIGVGELSPGRFSLDGISEEQACSFEVTKLNQALRPYVGPNLHVESRVFQADERIFVRITVPSISDAVALAYAEHQGAGLFQGRVYVRTDAAESVEVRDRMTLSCLLDRLIDQRLSARRRTPS